MADTMFMPPPAVLPGSHPAVGQDRYQIFLMHARRLFELCADAAKNDTALPPAQVKRMDAFVRLFNERSPAVQAGIFTQMMQENSPDVLTDMTMQWLRGQPLMAESDGFVHSRVILYIGKAYIDVGNLYSFVADRANHANNLMTELATQTVDLMEHASRPLQIVRAIYGALAAIHGSEEGSDGLTQRLQWCDSVLCQEAEDDSGADVLMQRAQRLIDPAVNILENVLERNVEGNSRLPPAFVEASAAFRAQMRQNPEADTLTRLTGALQGTFASTTGQNLMGTLEGMLSESNPGLRRFISSVSRARSGQDAINVLTSATEDPEMVAELSRGVSEAVENLMGPAPPSDRQQEANARAAQAQAGGQEYPSM